MGYKQRGGWFLDKFLTQIKKGGYKMREEEKYLMVALGRNIRFLRERKGLTQAQICQSLGISVSQLSRIENGEGTLHVFLLHGLAIVLNTTVDYLLAADAVKKRVDVTRYEDRRKYQLLDSNDYNFHAMSLHKHGNLFPFFVRVLKVDGIGIENDPLNYQIYHGEELAYVLEGRVKIYFGEEAKDTEGKLTIVPSFEFKPVTLNEWDTIHFEADIPHFYTYIPIPETDKERKTKENAPLTTNAKLFAVIEMGLDPLKRQFEISRQPDKKILIDKPPI